MISTGLGRRMAAFLLFALTLFGDDVQADVDALVTDVDGGTGDQLAHVPLALVAERALQTFTFVLLAWHAPVPAPIRPLRFARLR